MEDSNPSFAGWRPAALPIELMPQVTRAGFEPPTSPHARGALPTELRVRISGGARPSIPFGRQLKRYLSASTRPRIRTGINRYLKPMPLPVGLDELAYPERDSNPQLPAPETDASTNWATWACLVVLRVPRRIRTSNPQVRNLVLCPLSYWDGVTGGDRTHDNASHSRALYH